MKSLFVWDQKSLKVASLHAAVEFSPKGSNRFEKETATYALWLDYLEELEDEGKLHVLLAFITGLHDIPPL